MAKKVSNGSTAPSGFDTVCKSEFPINYPFALGKDFTGAIVMMKTASVLRNKVMTDVRIMIVHVAGVEYSIWESAGLTDLFNAAETGDALWLLYVGDIEVKGKPEPMKGYEGAIKKGAGHEYITSAPIKTEE